MVGITQQCGKWKQGLQHLDGSAYFSIWLGCEIMVHVSVMFTYVDLRLCHVWEYILSADCGLVYMPYLRYSSFVVKNQRFIFKISCVKKYSQNNSENVLMSC